MTKPSDNTIRAGFDDVAELATRLSVTASTLGTDGMDPLSRITWEQSDGLKAASYGSSGHARMWCWYHERDLSQCHKDSLGCSGERIDKKDPVGDSAITPDSAARDRRAIADAITTARSALVRIEGIFGRYPGPHAPTLFDIESSDGCQSCARVGAYSEPYTRREVEPGVEWRLCRWCGFGYNDLSGLEGVLPPREVVQAHHDAARTGKRLRARTEANGAVVFTLAGMEIHRVEMETAS